uniref:HMG box domain-containing protein n=1 Tax=Parascaris equorum TaxID=6256 RepID=A0A914REF9_PAREQ
MAKAKKASGSGSKKVKDPNAPKRAMSAFFFWMQENRERLKKPGMGVADVAKAAGVEWAKLADKSVSSTCSFLVLMSFLSGSIVFPDCLRLLAVDERRVKWEKKAAEDKKRYERDLAAYKKE